MALLAVLAQNGGEVTVTAGTITQVEREFRQLSYEFISAPVKGEFIVRLLTGETADGE